MALFITMEGSDGSGKTTQMNRLEATLRGEGYSVVRSREPGGTRIGEWLRQLILDPANTEMDDRTEALLYAASRAQHVKEVIRPALADGSIMLCDRFTDSSLIYQGIGRELSVEAIEALNAWATQDLQPDLTFVLYIDYEEGLRRKAMQNDGHLDRLEQAEEAFHRRVNDGYRMLAERYPERVCLIDATDTVEAIEARILEEVKRRLRED
jgi:dTMP kinase